VVAVVALVSVRGGASVVVAEAGGFGTATVSVAIVVLSSRGGRGFATGRRGVFAGGTGGMLLAIVPGCCIEPIDVSVCVWGSVKFVVVSAFVPVRGTDAVVGGGVSPGPLIVDVTPLVEPSCTTS
jgi:hypothetical protein